MIRYDLACENGHSFDGWFSTSDSYDEQVEAGVVTCPHCGSARVEKQLMTPQNRPAKDGAKGQRRQMMTGPASPKVKAMMKAMRQLHQQVKDNSEYVGPKFAEEARAIHYEEKPARGIYGEASVQDARDLIDEGVDIQPLPKLPEEGN